MFLLLLESVYRQNVNLCPFSSLSLLHPPPNFSSLHPSLSPSIWPRAASWWRPLAHLSSLTWNSTSKSNYACEAFATQRHKTVLALCLQQSQTVLACICLPCFFIHPYCIVGHVLCLHYTNWLGNKQHYKCIPPLHPPSYSTHILL